MIAPAIMAYATLANEALLDKEMSIDSGTRLCVYTDGSNITVREMQFCLLSK